MTTYPTSLQDLDATRGTASDTLAQPSHVAQHTLEDGTIEAIQTKLGIDSSADTNSIDYKLKNTASINPGHKHTLAGALTDVEITSPADGAGLFYDTASGKWKDGTTSVADASTTVKGVTKVSVAPASATEPIAVGDNDGRIPSQGENDALVGNDTSITVGTGNKFVTQTGLQNNAEKYAADAGATDAYAITLSPVPASYVAGAVYYFKANTLNTGACTLNVNGLGAKTIKKNYNVDLETGDILAGQFITVIYDGTNMQIVSPISKKQYHVMTWTSPATIANPNDEQEVVPFSGMAWSATNSTYGYRIPYNGTLKTLYTYATTTGEETASADVSVVVGDRLKFSYEDTSGSARSVIVQINGSDTALKIADGGSRGTAFGLIQVIMEI